MRCIFCKVDTHDSRSVEHIIPESMGNVRHVLPRGAVCDRCNGYFARKVERPLQETPLFRQLRFRMEVPSKRGRIPVWAQEEGSDRPSYRLMGRFLAKVALEVLAFRTLTFEGWNRELVEKAQLDELRDYARFNAGEDWPFTFRTIHPVNAVFSEGDDRYHLLHEFDLLLTDESETYSETYLALGLFGIELVLNLGGRSLDGYRIWLEKHEYASPLYPPSKA